MAGGFTAEIRAVELQAVRRKVAAARGNILLTNQAMTRGILEVVKPTVIANTSLGPAHFGYHGRDTLRIEVELKGTRVIGKLWGAVQMMWREFGTRGRSRRHLTAREVRLAVAFMGSGGGEPAFMTAHKAASGFRRVVNFYYGGLAKWWSSPPS